MTAPKRHLKTWGRYGYEKLERDSRGLIVRTTNHFEAVMAGKCKDPGSARVMIFSGGPECREYRYDTVSDEDRERLEAELGARFKRRT